jgi:hypothetical protein
MAVASFAADGGWAPYTYRSSAVCVTAGNEKGHLLKEDKVILPPKFSTTIGKLA